MFIAGIDGGGTHTRIEVRDMDNRLVRRGEFGPFNINSIGAAAFRGLLRAVFGWCGGMADCGGSIAGTARAVELCSYRLTSPGVGLEAGASLYGNTRNMFKGIFYNLDRHRLDFFIHASQE